MRTTPYIVILIVSIAFNSCDKPKPEVIPVSAPKVVPEITPMPIPESSATPSPIPGPIQSWFAPKEVFYVIKSFKITTEDEIVGFSRGRRITFAEARARAEEMEEQHQENVRTRRIRNIRNRIRQLDAGIATASQSLFDAYRAKSKGENIYEVYGNKVDAGTISSSGNQFELEQSINVWKQQKAALQKELRKNAS